MWPMPAFAATALALAVERFVGYPEPLYRAIGHPVEWIGRLISRLDKTLNDPAADPDSRRWHGIAALALLLVVCLIPTWIATNLFARLPYGWVIAALLATSLIAPS